MGPRLLDAVGIVDPVARGVAVGATAHALGTATLAQPARPPPRPSPPPLLPRVRRNAGSDSDPVIRMFR